MLSQWLAVNALLQVASALGFLHSKNIVHRDIRAQNVLIASEAPKFQAQVADLGVAYNLGGNAQARVDASSPLRTPCVCCEPLLRFKSQYLLWFDLSAEWMAPESIPETANAPKLTNTSTDMYMFGGLVYEVLSGKQPWSWMNPPDLLAQRRHALRNKNAYEEAVRLGHWSVIVDSNPVPGLVESLVQLMTRCFHSNPLQRPTAPAVISELTALSAQVKAIGHQEDPTRAFYV